MELDTEVLLGGPAGNIPRLVSAAKILPHGMISTTHEDVRDAKLIVSVNPHDSNVIDISPIEPYGIRRVDVPQDAINPFLDLQEDSGLRGLRFYLGGETYRVVIDAQDGRVTF